MTDNVPITPGTGDFAGTEQRTIDGVAAQIQRIVELGTADWTPFVNSSITAGSGSAALLVAARADRKRVVIQNVGSVPVRLGKASSADATSSFALDPGVAAVLETAAAIYAYIASGTGSVEGWEEHA